MRLLPLDTSFLRGQILLKIIIHDQNRAIDMCALDPMERDTRLDINNYISQSCSQRGQTLGFIV